MPLTNYYFNNVIVRIEFSPMEFSNDSNVHYYTLETTDNDQLEVTPDI